MLRGAAAAATFAILSTEYKEKTTFIFVIQFEDDDDLVLYIKRGPRYSQVRPFLNHFFCAR